MTVDFHFLNVGDGDCIIVDIPERVLRSDPSVEFPARMMMIDTHHHDDHDDYEDVVRYYLAPRWTPQNRPFVDTSKPSIMWASVRDEGRVTGRSFGVQIGVQLGAPASGAALENVRMVQQPIEERRHRGGVAEEFAPVIDRPI